MSFDGMWAALEPLGRHPGTGGYRRFAWTKEDAELREWFAGEAAGRGLDVVDDTAGNQWAWWGDPDRAVRAGAAGVVVGSHLDSVPDGGPFDGPLGVISAFAAIDRLRERQFVPRRPVAVARFVDEEGARFGVACAGSRIITGTLDPDQARSLTDGDGISLAEAMARSGFDPSRVGPDPEALRRVGAFVELHVEQGRGLAYTGDPLAVGSSIWPHGRWRLVLEGQANHAGTTRLEDRHDPMLTLAAAIQSARRAAGDHGCLATVGKVRVEPNGVNAIPSRVTAWLDARGPIEADVRAVASRVAAAAGVEEAIESFTPATQLDAALRHRVAAAIGGAPILDTGAGHDAGILAAAGLAAAMIFVRNPTGVSHAPDEYAERPDCLRGVEALTAVMADLSGPQVDEPG